MLAADDRLFVVTREGQIHCFGAEQRDVVVHDHRPKPADPNNTQDTWANTARDILEHTGVTEGYCVVLDAGTGQLIEALAAQTALRIIALSPTAEHVAQLRNRFEKTGLYGSRVAIIPGDITSASLPPYLASLVVSEEILKRLAERI